MGERLHTPVGTARYVSLLTPRARKDDKGQAKGEPKYQITLIFGENAGIRPMEKAAEAVALEAFGPKWKQLREKGKIRWPFRDNSDRVDDDDNPIPGFEEEGVHVGFKSKDKPGIVDRDAEPIMDKAEIYDGMQARVSCRPFAYDNESKGVSFFLINVQKMDDGDRLSGDPSAEDDFQPAKGKKKAPAAKKGKRAVDDDDDPLA